MRALSAFWRTVEPSSSMDAAVCCKAEACCSVRAERSLLPEAISTLAVATPSALWRTLPTMVARRDCMVASACSSWPVSSLPLASMGWVRSPSAMLSAACLPRCTGCTMERVTVKANSAPSATAISVPTPSNTWLALASVLVSPWLSASCAATVQFADLGEFVVVGLAGGGNGGQLRTVLVSVYQAFDALDLALDAFGCGLRVGRELFHVVAVNGLEEGLGAHPVQADV